MFPSQEEVEQVFLLTWAIYKAVLGLHYRRKEQQQTGQLAIFSLVLLCPDPPSMLIGYARVSTVDQTLTLQQDALTKAGCEQIFTDAASGSLADRPRLAEALAFARPGDTLVVWRLDWLGRSLRHLIDTVALLQERGIGFKSLQEQLDTTTSGGKLVFHVFGALAEFERDLIRERTQAGLLAARARGRLGGRPKSAALNTPRKVQIAQQLYHDKTNAIADICKTLHISRATLYRYAKDKNRVAYLRWYIPVGTDYTQRTWTGSCQSTYCSNAFTDGTWWGATGRGSFLPSYRSCPAILPA